MLTEAFPEEVAWDFPWGQVAISQARHLREHSRHRCHPSPVAGGKSNRVTPPASLLPRGMLGLSSP